MRLAGLLVALTSLALLHCTVAQTSQFFFLADWHVDPFYSASISSSDRCHNKSEIIRSGLPDRFYQQNSGNIQAWETDATEIQPNLNFGQYGCDSPRLLAASALIDMSHRLANPDFIIYCGDMSAHHLFTPEARFIAINDTIAEIATTFPAVAIYPTIGNNDCFPDYWLEYHALRPDRWLERIWTSWGVYSGIPSSQKDNFINGGYYVAQHSENLSIISLNTIYVCGAHNPDWSTSRHPDPAHMFAWLNTTLLELEENGQSAYIVGHVPPNRYWHQSYLRDYMNIVKRFQKVITAQMFAHTHRDEIHLFQEQGSAPFGWFMQAPSLTPKSDNNPSYRIVDYDIATTQFKDHTQYICGMTETQRQGQATWLREYSFREEYNTVGSGFITPELVQTTLTNIATNPVLFRRWKNNYETQYEDPSDKADYLCEMFYDLNDDVSDCEDLGTFQPLPNATSTA